MNTLLYDDLEPILDFALPQHDLGFSISPPIPPHGKFPFQPWKEYQIERASKKQLIEWSFEFPYWNYGVITGSLSGIVCLDADNSDAEAAISKHCPPTPMHQLSGSGRGQYHIYCHPGIHVPTRKNLTVHGVEVKGLDLRGDGALPKCIVHTIQYPRRSPPLVWPRPVGVRGRDRVGEARGRRLWTW